MPDSPAAISFAQCEDQMSGATHEQNGRPARQETEQGDQKQDQPVKTGVPEPDVKALFFGCRVLGHFLRQIFC